MSKARFQHSISNNEQEEADLNKVLISRRTSVKKLVAWAVRKHLEPVAKESK